MDENEKTVDPGLCQQGFALSLGLGMVCGCPTPLAVTVTIHEATISCRLI